MDRLTGTHNGILVYVGQHNPYSTGMISGELGGPAVREIMTRLSEYEDTGLAPAEIRSLQAEWNAMRELVDILRDQRNDPLTLEELGRMDGQPVWIVAAPDWGHWELSEDAEDYLEDRDPDFYGMKYDDPAGKYGLHVSGWLAYRRPPRTIEKEGE